MNLFILLLLTGLCSGLQYPLQYVYHYRAKVSAGISDINDRHAAVSDLRANLNVYVTSPTSIVFQLDGVSFGEFNGPKDCEQSKEQPPSWVTPQYDSQLGRFPFALENGVLIFNEEEEQWTINFYKSIVGVFTSGPLMNTFRGVPNNHTSSAAYDTTEDTIMGMCRASYTQHKLTGVAAAQRELFTGHHVIEDVQADSLGAYVTVGTSKTTGGRKTTAGRRRRRATKRPPSKTSKTSKTRVAVPDISNTLWEVVRSVNLENCEDRVEHQHSLVGGYCLLSGDQCKNLYSRNSHGVYYLRGDENGMRLEKAKIKGAIVISPYGHETEHIETITKQKLALVSVNHLESNAPSLEADSTVTVDKLVYEMTLPYDDFQNNPYRWVKVGNMKESFAKLFGVPYTEEQHTRNEEQVVGLLNGATELLDSSQSQNVANIPVMLNYASFLLLDFTEVEITRVIAALKPETRDLLYGVLAEVGTAPAYNVMLKMLKDGEVSSFRQVMFFGTMNINIKSAASLRSILDFLLSQNMDDTPYKTSQSLVNFASVVKRLCLGRGGGFNSFEEFSKQRCAQDGIVTSFVEFVVTELQQTETFWKQMVLVKALVNLKTAEATNALLPYVLGARACNDMVRAVAMDSLASWNAAGRVYRSKIVLILLDIFENPAESRLLRARALGYLASWQLTSTEWTRLAFATKRPGLKDLAALTYSLIKSTSEYEHPEMIQQRQYAQHALRIAKPTSAADRYSSYLSWYKYNFAHQVGAVDHINLIRDPTSPLPSELSLYMRRNLGGLIFHKKADIMMANDDGDLDMIAIELFLDKPWRGGDAGPSGRWTSFLNMLKADLNIEEKVRTAVRGLANLVPIAGMQLFVPFEHAMLLDAMRSISGSEAPYLSMAGPSSFYMNTVDNAFTTVNDLGLPVITTVARPTFISFKGSTQFYNSGPEKYKLDSSGTNALYSSTLRVNVDTVIPWSHSQLATGVIQQTGLNLPFSPNVHFSWNYRQERERLLTVALTPSAFVKTGLITRENLPYTAIKDSAPVNLDSLQRAIKVIYVNGADAPKYQTTKSVPLTSLEYTYAGDVKSDLGPFLKTPFSSIFKLVSKGTKDDFESFLLTSSLKMFRSEISGDFTNARETSYLFNFTTATAERLPNAGKFVSKYGQDGFEDYELCGKEGSADTYTQQTGQQSSDDYMFEQAGQSQDQEFESFGSFGQQQAQVPAQLNDPTEAETVRPSQGIGDVSEPQLSNFLTYLQRQTGWKSKVKGASIRLEVERGGAGESLTYEVVMATTTCYSLLNQFQQKAVVVVAKKGDPCDTLCLEAETTQPKINDLDTLPLILAKNLDRTMKQDFYTGNKCSQGPFHSQVEERQLTEAGLARLLNELEQEKCRRRDQVDLVQEFAKRAEYDHFVSTGNYTFVESIQCRSPLASRVIQFFMLLREHVLKMSNPTLCPEDFHGTGGTHSSVGERDEDGEITFHEKFGEKSITNHISSYPDMLTNTNKIAFLTDYEPADYCVMDEHSVTTFDGRQANFTTSMCPVLVSTPCEGQPDVFVVAVKTSRTGGLSVQMAGQKRQFIINMDAEGIDVNGAPMEANEYVKNLLYSTRGSEKSAGHLYRRNGFYKVEIDDTVDVLLKEGKVYVKVAPRYRGYMCGLCGNYDDEPSNDIKAPNGCLITDPEEFGKAWTPSTGFECFAEQQTDPDTCLKEEPLPHDYYEQYQL